MNSITEIRVISLRDLWEIFIHRLWIIVLAAAIGVVGLYTVNAITFEPRYQATATMYITRQSGSEDISSNDASTDFSLALKVVNDCTYFLKSHTVLDAVMEELDLDLEYDTLYKSVSTSNPEDTRILEVTVEAESPKLAKKIVDSICTVGTSCINEAMGYEQVTVYELGVMDDDPCNKTGLTVYIMVGLVIAVLVYFVFLLTYLLDDTIKSDEDIERYLGLSVLGDIPDADSTHKTRYGYGYGRAKNDSKEVL